MCVQTMIRILTAREISVSLDGIGRLSAQLLGSCVLIGLLLTLGVTAPVHASSRIKDIVDFEGVRDNMLVGYGLVVELTGTGDDLGNSAFTQQSLVSMLERLGVNTRNVNLKTKNVAAVMVTATLPSFSRQGTRIDVSVSSLSSYWRTIWRSWFLESTSSLTMVMRFSSRSTFTRIDCVAGASFFLVSA